MKKPGSILMVIGLVLIAAALALLARNNAQAREAGREAQAILTELAEAIRAEEQTAEAELPPPPEETAIPVMPLQEIDGRNYIGIVEIPALGISLPVAENCTDEQLALSPCRYAGSYFTHDLVICGHNYPEHFARIKYIQAGETVYFVTATGERQTYFVLQSETVWPLQIERMINRENEEWDLTLFTCHNGGESRCAIRCALA